MAIEAGDIQWNIGADLKGFKAGMAEASKSAKSMGAKFAKHSKAIGAGMTAAGGAITASLGKSVSHFAKVGDQVQKMAIKTGVGTEALSELGFAAEQSGTNIEVLGKGFKAQADFLEDAKDGLSTATDAMDKLGLSLSDLQGKSPEDVFMVLGDAIGSIEDPIQRAALANDVFRRSGVELLPLFASGATGIKALREEAQRLGISLSQEQADAAAKFTDTLNSLKKSMSGIALQVGGALVPALNAIMERIAPVISGITSWMKANPKLTSTIIMIAGALGAVMLVLGPLLIALPGLMAAFGGITAAGALMAAKIAIVVGAGFLMLRGVFAEAKEWITANWETIKAVFMLNVEIIGNYLSVMANIVRSVLGVVGAILTGTGQAWGETFKGMADDSGTSTGSISDTLLMFADKVAELTGFIADQTRAMSDFIIENWDEIVSATKWFQGNVLGPLGSVLKFMTGFANKIVGLIDKVVNAFDRLSSVGVPSLSGDGGSLPGFASGGVTPGGLAMVGERGPEIAAFPKGTRIMTNAQTRQAVSEGVSGGTSAGNTSSLSMGDMVINVTAGSGSSPQAISTQIKNDIYRDMAGIWNRIRG